MNTELLKANLNLYAVLPRIAQLLEHDEEAKNIARDWNFTMQFKVINGPAVSLHFNNGKMTFSRGSKPSQILLLFPSCEKLNAMINGENVTPIPLKGLTKIKILLSDFPKLAKRLEKYLKPTEQELKDPKIFNANLEMTLYTAVAAVKEIADMDPIGKANKHHIADGKGLLMVKPDGPYAHFIMKNGEMTAGIGKVENPDVVMAFRNPDIAFGLFNGKVDAFAAMGLCDVTIRGRVPMIEAINPILDRIPLYLS